jgi:hypothetical protein
MLKKVSRAALAEFPLALVLMGGFAYLHVTGENAVEMFLSFVVALCVLGIIDSFIHEGGHVLCGLWYGVPLARVRIGVGPVLLRCRVGRVPLDLHMIPIGGRVDHQYLPISRRQRIVMYAGGIGASVIGAIGIWFAIPSSLGWPRTEVVLAFPVFNLVNLFGTAPKGANSDGTAIRGQEDWEMEMCPRGYGWRWPGMTDR